MNITKLGIIAGSGDLPTCLVEGCLAMGIEPFIVGFHDNTDPDILKKHPHLFTDLGKAGKVIKFFKKHDVKDLVLIGGIKRPSLRELKPDLRGAKILSRIGLSPMGDNTLLSLLKRELESDGLKVHGIRPFCQDLLAAEGTLGQVKPNDEDMLNIRIGIEASQMIGKLDVGQSVIIQQGLVIGIEAVEGTDALIARCGELQKSGQGGVLVKTMKPQQDRDLDIPTIGLDTIINAHKAGLRGIALQADNVLIVNPKKVAQYADQYKMFVVGVNLDDTNSQKI